jgi:hypothetical protein
MFVSIQTAVPKLLLCLSHRIMATAGGDWPMRQLRKVEKAKRLIVPCWNILKSTKWLWIVNTHHGFLSITCAASCGTYKSRHRSNRATIAGRKSRVLLLHVGLSFDVDVGLVVVNVYECATYINVLSAAMSTRRSKAIKRF